MVPTFYRGVPVGNLQKANRYTVPGSLVDVWRYRRARGINEADAILATDAAIKALPLPAHLNPYHQALATDIYNVKLTGLGDGGYDFDPGALANKALAEQANQPPATSQWASVLNTVVGNLSQGLACKISGACKPVTGLPLPPPASSFPSTAQLAMIGGAGLLAFMLLRRRAAA